MAKAVVDLDKSFSPVVSASYGTVRLRVVVLKQKAAGESEESEIDDLPGDDAEEPIDSGKTPLDSYLERPRGRGKQCVVFLVHGQRHEGLDNTFVVRSLGFKYLRSRTMIVVDLDDLAPEAVAEIVQGSRQGLFRGNAYHAINERIIATLKGDPDLRRLEAEAEQKIAELETGDEAVRTKLDQLIEEHHAAGSRVGGGDAEAGKNQGLSMAVRGDKGTVIVGASPDVGATGVGPVLVTVPEVALIRVKPNERRVVVLQTEPLGEWPNVERVLAQTEPKIDELSLSVTQGRTKGTLSLLFNEPADAESEDYPISTTLRVFATVKGHSEPRLLQKQVIVYRPGPPPPPPAPTVLHEHPTFLRVTSRQPLKLLPGGPSVHVKLRWDGVDSLTTGAPPAWQFHARCLNLETFPTITFSKPSGGKFELLLDVPHGMLPKQELQFEVEGVEKAAGRKLSAVFRAEVVEPPLKPEARKVPGPELAGQRRPPYELKYVKNKDWANLPCWNGAEWSGEDAGYFTEPAEGKALVLMINVDAHLLKNYSAEMIEKKLDEKTVQTRLTRYNAHVSFHLWQMYLDLKKKREKNKNGEEDINVPNDVQMRGEINRVADTLVRLMRVSH